MQPFTNFFGQVLERKNINSDTHLSSQFNLVEYFKIDVYYVLSCLTFVRRQPCTYFHNKTGKRLCDRNKRMFRPILTTF